MLEGIPQRGRGRPRKYPPKTNGDFESTKYDIFFNLNERGPEEGKEIDVNAVVQEVFQFIYRAPTSNKLFSHPNNSLDNPVLSNLELESPMSNQPKNLRTCDEVFYEYLLIFKNKTNTKFFSLMLKFILLFRECYDLSKNKDNNEKKCVTNTINPEGLPDLCNEFYGEFLEPNNFFINSIFSILSKIKLW